MKKILFFVCLAVVMVGCEQKKDNTKSENTSDNPVKEGSVAPAAACGDIIINKTLLGSNYTAWRTNYSTLICSESGNDIYIDLSKITPDPDNTEKAEWLEINGSAIDYVKSKPLIVQKHKIVETEIVSRVTTDKVEVSDIKTEIGQYAYLYDKYNQYLEISRSPFAISSINSFSSGNSFSIPFLRAILDGLADDTEVEIIDAKIKDGNSEVRAWLIKVGNYYFNYSKWPAH